MCDRKSQNENRVTIVLSPFSIRLRNWRIGVVFVGSSHSIWRCLFSYQFTVNFELSLAASKYINRPSDREFSSVEPSLSSIVIAIKVTVILLVVGYSLYSAIGALRQAVVKSMLLSQLCLVFSTYWAVVTLGGTSLTRANVFLQVWFKLSQNSGKWIRFLSVAVTAGLLLLLGWWLTSVFWIRVYADLNDDVADVFLTSSKCRSTCYVKQCVELSNDVGKSKIFVTW